jgi:hypothetical protein
VIDLWKGEKYISQFVLGLGAVGGFFFRMGFDLEGSLAGATITSLSWLDANSAFIIAFAFIGFAYALSAWQLKKAFSKGGLMGLVAVTLCLFGTFFLPSIEGVIMFALALVLGFAAPYFHHSE